MAKRTKEQQYWHLQVKRDKHIKAFRKALKTHEQLPHDVLDEAVNTAADIDNKMFKLACDINVESIEIVRHQANALNSEMERIQFLLDDRRFNDDTKRTEEMKAEVVQKITRLKQAVWEGILNPSNILVFDMTKSTLKEVEQLIGVK